LLYLTGATAPSVVQLRTENNRTYRRTGTLFGGRFRSSVIQADSDLLACQGYIELNKIVTILRSMFAPMLPNFRNNWVFVHGYNPNSSGEQRVGQTKP
jgi:hypothetical protein